MKIALIGRYGEGDIISGPERVARELYVNLKKKNIDVTFIEYFFSGYSDYSLINKISGSKVKKDEVLRLGVIPMIFKLFKEKFQIIHLINSQRFLLLFFILKPFFKTKTISTLHGLHQSEIKALRVKRTFLDLLTEKKIIKNSDHLIFPSKLLLSLFNRHYKVSEGKCHIVYNGLSKDFKSEKNNFKADKYNFVFYNSLGRGLTEFLSSIPEEIYPRIRVFVIGIKTKKNLINNLEVIYTDQMDQRSLINFLKDKHFVIKSAFESFSILTAECMSAGLIPIVSEETGIKEIIENKVNGFIYNSKEKNNLSSLLLEIISGKYNLQEISLNASKISEQLNWDKISDRYLSIYKSVL